MPVWMVKQLCPSSEYHLWKSYFAIKWQENDKIGYEFALLRDLVASLVDGKSEVEKHMLTNRFTEPDKDWEDLTTEEQEEAMRKMRSTASTMFGRKKANG